MTSRPLMLLAVICVCVGAGFVTAASDGDGDRSPKQFEVVLDNAFGLTEGVDLRSDGVRVGQISKLDLERSTGRAIATAEIEEESFAGFRADVFCDVQPQSLIGEYFMNCTPGKSSEPAPERVPVEQTGGTIPPDLVQSILRRPARERLGVILTELGAGVASRGPDLQATILRAVPALRETDKVLRLLGDNSRTLTALTRDSDTVLAQLDANKRDVGRFVDEARDTADVSASRQAAIRETVRKLPGFLRELRPTLAGLGSAAALQTPALRDLRLGATQLETLFDRLGPFAEAARPAVRSLGDASDTGREAAREARSTVKQLRTLARNTTEPARNARIILEDLNDRGRAVEPNRLSPTGAGFTGFEALLQYPFVQSQAVNIYDSKGYLLKLNILVNKCTQYANAATYRANPERVRDCTQALGPNQPGLTDGTGSRTAPSARSENDLPEIDLPAIPGLDTDSPTAPQAAPAPGDAAPAAPEPGRQDDLLDRLLPILPTLPLPKDLPSLSKDRGSSAPSTSAADRSLLDFLLGGDR